MIKRPLFFGIHARPNLKFNAFLASLPFIVLILSYLLVSHIRLADNPSDRLFPSFTTIAETIVEYTVKQDKSNCIVRNQETNKCEEFGKKYTFLEDISSSMSRICTGIVLAAVTGLGLGIILALFPGPRSLANPFVIFLSIIPPLALMPILMAAFGTDETAKIALIFIGIVFMITRSIYLAVRDIPIEQIVKALTLGATEREIACKIVLPQVFPALLDAIRLNLGSAWLFLIASEVVSAESGLGYRISLYKRVFAMDVIVPYVLLITLLGFLMDYAIRIWIIKGYPWYVAQRGGK